MKAKTISDILKPKSREELDKVFSEIKIGSYNLEPFMYKLWDKPWKTKQLLKDIVVNKLKMGLTEMEVAMLYRFPAIQTLFDNILQFPYINGTEDSLIEFQEGIYINYNEDEPFKNSYNEYRERPNIYFVFSKKYKIIKIISPTTSDYYIFPKNLNFKHLYI